MTPRQGFSLILLAHVLVWTVVPTLTNGNLPLDVIEHLVWGREWQMGYDKHPPLVAWMLETAGWISGGRDWGPYAVSQLCVGIALWAMWRLGLTLFDERQALISVVLMEGVYYHTYSSPEFNVNVALMAFWALTILAYRIALEHRTSASWLALGVTAGLAILGKYTAGFLLLALLIHLIIDPRARTAWRSSGPYLAGVSLLLVITPHLIWMWQHDFITLTYAVNRTGTTRTLLDHVRNPLEFLLAQLILLLFPWLMLRSLGPRAALGRDPERSRFILLAALGPLLLIAMLSLLTGMRMRSMWGSPMLVMAGIVLVWYAGPAMRSWNVRRFAMTATLVALFFPAAYVATYIYGDGKRTQFPGRVLAETISGEWHARYGTPLPTVVSTYWLGGNVSWYSADRPSVYIEADPAKAPWVDEAELRRTGAIVVWHVGEPFRAEQLDRIGPLETQPTLSLEWLGGAYEAPSQIGWGIIPPTAN